MLPDIKIKLKSIMERKKVADTLRDEVERFSLVGFEVSEARQKTEQLDFIVKDLMSNISELEDLGVKLREIDTGLLDFPAKRVGEVVYLCWKYGESSVEFWQESPDGLHDRIRYRSAGSGWITERLSP